MTGDTPAQPLRNTRSGLIRALLAEAGAPRLRVVDDHMFTIERAFAGPASFRLQLFTAPQARPVAIVIQRTDEGTSLINAAERYAEAVWQRHCPAEPQPPVWIQRQLMPGWERNDLTFVPFPVEGPYRLGAPERWIRITEQEIARLVGAPFGPFSLDSAQFTAESAIALCGKVCGQPTRRPSPPARAPRLGCRSARSNCLTPSADTDSDSPVDVPAGLSNELSPGSAPDAGRHGIISRPSARLSARYPRARARPSAHSSHNRSGTVQAGHETGGSR